MTDSLTALILAAGLSRRMGTPKMLLPWGNTTVLGQVAATFAQVGVNEVLIVTGGARELVETEAAWLAGRYPVRCIHNPQFETGEMLSSLQCGLAALGSQVKGILLGLGDQPQLSINSAQAVVSAGMSLPGQIIVPSHDMRRGHPWLLPRVYWAEILALKPPQTLRDFLNLHAADIHYIDADQTILKNLDTPDEYQREKP